MLVSRPLPLAAYHLITVRLLLDDFALFAHGYLVMISVFHFVVSMQWLFVHMSLLYSMSHASLTEGRPTGLHTSSIFHSGQNLMKF